MGGPVRVIGWVLVALAALDGPSSGIGAIGLLILMLTNEH